MSGVSQGWRDRPTEVFGQEIDADCIYEQRYTLCYNHIWMPGFTSGKEYQNLDDADHVFTSRATIISSLKKSAVNVMATMCMNSALKSKSDASMIIPP